MPSPQVDAFVASLKRCLATPDFLHRFYDDFMASSPEIKAKFARTDFPRQTRVLADSLFVLANAAQGQPGSPADQELTRLAERHDRHHMDIAPEMYDLWLDCLVGAARQYDPQFDDEIEQAWRSTLRVGVEAMRSRY